MSKISDLINKLCPNGVEYKSIGACCKIETGKLNANAAVENGEYMFFTTAKEPSKTDTYRWDEEALLIAGNANIGDVKHYNGKFNAYQRTYVLTNFSKDINVKYLYFSLSNNLKVYLDKHKNEAAMTYIVLSTLENFKIAVPPLEVQDEIVRILDDFTLLSAELSAELKARQTQYEFYRDELLAFNNKDYEWKTLGEIATDMYRGNGIKRNDVKETGIPCVRYGEIYTSYNVTFNKCISHTDENIISKKKYFEHGDVLFAITGETVEEIGKSTVYLGDDKCLAGGDMVVMKHNQNPKYMAYVLSTTQAQMQKSRKKVKSKVVHSSIPDLKEIYIPIPPLKVQEKVADILEQFDKLCNDIAEGLPAEIEARKKQYEYYRDKLLTFKELKIKEE